MKRLLLFLVLIGIGFFLFNSVKQQVKKDLSQPLASTGTTSEPTVTPIMYKQAQGEDTTSVFVPYWTIKSTDTLTDSYNTYLYFGVTPSDNGLETDDQGAKSLDSFLQTVPDNKKKLLVVSMLNSDQSLAILKDQKKQQALITQTASLAKAHGFDGVVLDLELSALPFDSLLTQVTTFITNFHSTLHSQQQTFSVLLYGDTFYRLRPFDVKHLSDKADTFYIMAYDFHKARGNPGPNFPLSGKDSYGYDLGAMSDQFLQYIPANKLTVVFGLFGYDWQVDDQGNATDTGKPLTDNQIQEQFLTKCAYTNCSIKRDATSSETQIRYTDTDGTKHIVWFEDMNSVSKKEELLRKKGINSFSFWANSYF